EKTARAYLSMLCIAAARLWVKTLNTARISADISSDQRTGESYYTIRISIPPEELSRLGDVKLVPGMPVECFIQTGERTVISYLLKPLRDQLMRTFRERG